MKSSLIKKLETSRFAVTADKVAAENVSKIMDIAGLYRLVTVCR